ncbi:hypothetical protein J0H33_08940 [bacterium]|nr:hypothetical protein [bacterium]
MALAVLFGIGAGPWSSHAGADQPVPDGAAVGARLQTSGPDTLGAMNFSRATALTRLTTIANAELAATLNRPHGSDGVNVPAVTIGGHPITVSDLQLTQIEFLPAATKVVSAENTDLTLQKPTDVWVAAWKRTGVPAPDWGGIPTTVRAVAVIEDGTGKVLSIDVGRGKQD